MAAPKTKKDDGYGADSIKVLKGLDDRDHVLSALEPDVERLWQAIRATVRLDEPDPVAAAAACH